MKKVLLIILLGFSAATVAGQQESARNYADTVNVYVNKWISSNHPNNPQLGTPEQYIPQGESWYQTGVKLRSLDNNAKGVSTSFKKRTTLAQVTETCQDSTIDNTAMLNSIVATKDITKACIKTVMDGYEAGE
ncbi:hypothetical protein N6P31_01375 [Pectobacterium betavasculorum]|uniref:hypothetical protein n=1 Tax=Pectobacterium betavasculorum TaxID=55207 RepID=UPI00313B4D88